jgi:hypothetical protein
MHNQLSEFTRHRPQRSMCRTIAKYALRESSSRVVCHARLYTNRQYRQEGEISQKSLVNMKVAGSLPQRKELLECVVDKMVSFSIAGNVLWSK